MKRTLLYFYLLLFVCFWPSVAYAEVITHNFKSMAEVPATIAFTNSNKTGTTTDGMVYTCSGGAAAFDAYTLTPYPICIKLKNSGAKATTTRVADLDSLDIQRYPVEDFKVEYSADSISWTTVEFSRAVGNAVEVKLPAKGDYYIRFSRKSNDVYLSQIKFITKPCHCLRVVSE